VIFVSGCLPCFGAKQGSWGKQMMTRFMALAAAVVALGGGLAATTAAAPAASASVRPKVVAFNWWHAIHHEHRPNGARHASHYFPSVRPEALGGRYVKHPLNDIVWKRRGGSANPNSRLNNVTDFILWYARSAEFLQTPIMQTLRWLRIPGDTVFAAGAIALVVFVGGLKTGRSFRTKA
jgi:hypothetical protein